MHTYHLIINYVPFYTANCTYMHCKEDPPLRALKTTVDANIYFDLPLFHGYNWKCINISMKIWTPTTLMKSSCSLRSGYLKK